MNARLPRRRVGRLRADDARRRAPTRCALLADFLGGDDHYRASSAAYGDGGARSARHGRSTCSSRGRSSASSGSPSPKRTATRIAVGACVVCYAISTSRGTLVAKLDDVTVARRLAGARRRQPRCWLRSAAHLRARGITRIDTACHRDNAGAWRFYERLGFARSTKSGSRSCSADGRAAHRVDSRRRRRPPLRRRAAEAVRGPGRPAAPPAHPRAAPRRARRPTRWSWRWRPTTRSTTRVAGAPRGVEALRCGGATRAETVANALAALADRCADDDWILVHDAARPCVPRRRAAAARRRARATTRSAACLRSPSPTR